MSQQSEIISQTQHDQFELTRLAFNEKEPSTTFIDPNTVVFKTPSLIANTRIRRKIFYEIDLLKVYEIDPAVSP